MTFIKKWFTQPFVYRAGLQIGIIGFIIMMVTAAIAAASRTHFDGIIDAHVGRHAPLWIYPAESLLNWLCTFLLFFLAGVLLSKSKVRWADMAGTMAYARLPMLFVAIIGFMIQQPPEHHDLAAVSLKTLAAGFIMLLFSVWMIVLMYQAFRISANIKGSRAIAGFIFTLIVAEVLSKYLFSILYSCIQKT